MAETTFGGRISVKAGADLSALQYTCVKLNSSGLLVAATAATDKILGVLQNAPKSGDTADVALRNGGGVVKAKAGGTIAVNDALTSNGSGLLITTVTASDQIVGFAREAAVVNQIFELTPSTDKV